RSVEVWRDVRPHGAERRQRLEPDVADDASVVPPIGETPWHDVVASPPVRIVDSNQDRVLGTGDDRKRGVEREWRVAAFVVAEVLSVQPDVRDVADRAKL